ncbi:MAG: hypothetical protein ACLR0F_05825 [Eisenbergiella sp.]
MEEDILFEMHSDDLLILPAGRHHYGNGLSTPHNKHMYIHVKPLETECLSNAAVTGGCAVGTGRLLPADEAAAFTEFHSLIHCQSNPHIKELFQEIIAECWDLSLSGNPSCPCSEPIADRTEGTAGQALLRRLNAFWKKLPGYTDNAADFFMEKNWRKTHVCEHSQPVQKSLRENPICFSNGCEAGDGPAVSVKPAGCKAT